MLTLTYILNYTNFSDYFLFITRKKLKHRYTSFYFILDCDFGQVTSCFNFLIYIMGMTNNYIIGWL